MRTFNSAEPWAKGRVILGQSVSELPITRRGVANELMNAGCSDDMVHLLVSSAFIVTIAINKMMEKTI